MSLFIYGTGNRPLSERMQALLEPIWHLKERTTFPRASARPRLGRCASSGAGAATLSLSLYIYVYIIRLYMYIYIHTYIIYVDTYMYMNIYICRYIYHTHLEVNTTCRRASARPRLARCASSGAGAAPGCDGGERLQSCLTYKKMHPSRTIP